MNRRASATQIQGDNKVAVCVGLEDLICITEEGEDLSWKAAFLSPIKFPTFEATGLVISLSQCLQPQLSFEIPTTTTMRSLLVVLAAVVLQSLPLTVTALSASNTETPESVVPPESSFREPTATNLLYAHILFMIISWVGGLPICSLPLVTLRFPIT